ncbi:MAG: hypothetical protein JXQ23_12860 [Clostridia bacterium]|nr:hypothetical protein [Clostridia bacterium]
MKMNLSQPCFNSTLVGCLTGAARYYNLDISDVMIYGLSGHAFVINTVKDLCPSGPYTWDMSQLQKLCKNFGLYPRLDETKWIVNDSDKEFVKKCENDIKHKMDSGIVVMLVSLEHQLFEEYDNEAFLITLPWGKVPSETKRIEYGNWPGPFSGYTAIEKVSTSVSIREAIHQTLEYAAHLIFHSQKDDNGCLGLCAYDNWIDCVKRGHGSSHGNWWNGMVWSESKLYASKFFKEISKYGYNLKECNSLSEIYYEISELLSKIKDKELADNSKISLLEEAGNLEKTAGEKIENLIKKV